MNSLTSSTIIVCKLFVIWVIFLKSGLTYGQAKEGKILLENKKSILAQHKPNLKSVNYVVSLFSIDKGTYYASISRRKKSFNSNIRHMFDFELIDIASPQRFKYKQFSVDNVQYLTYGMACELGGNRVRPFVGGNCGFLFIQYYTDDDMGDSFSIGINLTGGVDIFITNRWSICIETKYRLNFKYPTISTGLSYSLK